MSEYRSKRALDICVVTLGAPLWVPLLALTGLLVRIVMGRGVLFRQTRPGRNERLFVLIKFRTMRNDFDADGRALPDSERLTTIGRLLRATSLDELPELLNVLRGEMSLVGPRPLLPQYLSRYSTRHRRRHEVRPGLTGLAQVAGRNAMSWQERLDLDVAYVDRCSLWLDLKILARTVAVVVLGSGVSAPGYATMPEFTGYAAGPENAGGIDSEPGLLRQRET